MADPLKKALVDRGYQVRVYAPYGPLIPGMAYLVRRILENTSNESFLKMDFAHESDEDTLLNPPVFHHESTAEIKKSVPVSIHTFSNAPST